MKSLAHQFLDFCRSKPAEEAYPFWHAERCAVGQFIASRGLNVFEGEGWDIFDRLHDGTGTVGDEPWTFGALADRLEKALS